MAKAKQQSKVTATEALERFDPSEEEDFSDVDGDVNNEFTLAPESVDPDRHDVWVHNDPDTIRQYREGVLKYEPVHIGAAGQRCARADGEQEGEILTRRDHILMSCDEGRFRKRERFERFQNAKDRKAMGMKAQKSVSVYQGAVE